MDLGIPVNFADGGQQKTGIIGPGNAKRVMRAESTCFHRLDRQVGIAVWGGRIRTGGGSKMQYRVHMLGNKNKAGNIMPYERKVRIGSQVRQVPRMPGDEVIHPDDLMASAQKQLT